LAVKILPALQWNIPEQLAFTTNAILVGEPAIPKIPTPPPVTPVVEMTPSDLGSLSGCFRFFHWTRILGIAEPGRTPGGDTSQMRLGSIAHRLLERDLPPSPETLAAASLRDLGAVFESREWREVMSASPERELPFIMHVNVEDRDCWVRGRMDVAVAPSANGELPRVVDYKYALWREGSEGDYDIQMTAYALALMKAMGTTRAAAELWYLKSPMRIVRREYTRVEAEERLTTLLAKYLNAMKWNEWPAAEREYCDQVECGFRQQCWSAT
jgi:CRISPR/Cas system-associated exonuclease Cas4 (RecB family)